MKKLKVKEKHEEMPLCEISSVTTLNENKLLSQRNVHALAVAE